MGNCSLSCSNKQASSSIPVWPAPGAVAARRCWSLSLSSAFACLSCLSCLRLTACLLGTTRKRENNEPCCLSVLFFLLLFLHCPLSPFLSFAPSFLPSLSPSFHPSILPPTPSSHLISSVTTYPAYFYFKQHSLRSCWFRYCSFSPPPPLLLSSPTF